MFYCWTITLFTRQGGLSLVANIISYSGVFQLLITFNDFQLSHITIPVHLTCPATFEAVGDGCYIQAGENVTQSADCIVECGDDAQPAEVHSTEQLDALKAYVNSDEVDYFVMGNNTVCFLIVDHEWRTIEKLYAQIIT